MGQGVLSAIVSLVRTLVLVAIVGLFVILYRQSSRNVEAAEAAADERYVLAVQAGVSSHEKPNQSKRRRGKRPAYCGLPDLADEISAPAPQENGSYMANLKPADPLGFSAEFVKLGSVELLPTEVQVTGTIITEMPMNRIASRVDPHLERNEWFRARLTQQHAEQSYVIEYEDRAQEINLNPSLVRFHGDTATFGSEEISRGTNDTKPPCSEEHKIPEIEKTAPSVALTLTDSMPCLDYPASSDAVEPHKKSYLAVVEADTGDDNNDEDSEDLPNTTTVYEGFEYEEYEVMQEDDDDWQMVSHRPAKAPQEREEQHDEKIANLKARNKWLQKQKKDRLVSKTKSASS